MRKKTKIDKKFPFHNFLLKFSLIAVFIFLLLLSFLYYEKIKDFMGEKKEASIQLRMDQISGELQTEFNNIYDTISNLKTNEIVLRYVDELSGSELTPSEKYYQLENLEEYLYTIRQNNKLIDNILIITPKSQFSSDSKYVDYKFNGMKLKKEVENNYHFVSIGEANKMVQFPSTDEKSANDASIPQDLNKSMFFGTNIVSAEGVNKGVILVFISPKNLDDHIFYADHISLFDQNGTLFFKGNQVDQNISEELEKQKVNKKGFLVTSEDSGVYSSSIPYYNFQLIYAEQLSFYNKQIQLMWIVIALTFVFTALVAYILSRIVGRRVLQPLYRLMESLKEYEESRNYSILLKKDRNGHLKMSLRERFFFYFVMTIMVPLLFFMAILYWQTLTIVSGDLQESYHSVHEKMARLMNNEINQRELTMARIAYNNNVQHYISENDTEKIGHELLDKRKYLELRRQNVRIYNDAGMLLYTNSYNQTKHLDTGFYGKLRNSGRKISYVLERDHFNNVTIVIGMPIFSPTNYSRIIGYITVDIDNNQLANFYSDWRKTGLDIFVADQRNMILSHQDPLKIGEMFEDKKSMLQSDNVIDSNYHVYSTEITGLDWEFISKYNYSDIQKQINQLFISDLYLIFFILLLLLAFAFWISKRMLKPFGQLNALFHTFDLNGTHHEVAVADQLSGIDEVDSLTRNFNKMIHRMEELIHETLDANKERIQLKYEKRELQINALQSQINPHFLYNTLDNLIYLVESKETDKAVEMIASLSRLFRFITNREQVMITIRDELIYTKAYIKIMSYRFDNFKCVWDIDEKIKDFKTVKLIMQPVIENAIHHGARKTKKMVIINISCKLIGDEIHINFKDNADGISEEDLSLIKNQLASADLDQAGIYNVNGRIGLHFGNIYGLDIQSKLGEGTQVTIVIPAMKQ